MIDLGASGASVTLATTEAGGWTRDGEAFSSGTTVQGGTSAATGGANEYELTFGEDGTWTAAFVPVEVMIDLGASGASVTLATTEAGGWTRDGEAFSSGTTVQGGTSAATGGANEYELTFGEDGTWTAAFVPVEVMIDLGASGASVTLATTEAGGWTRDGEAFSSGTTVQGGNNAATGAANEYELTLADGEWTPTYRPARMTISGTGGLEAVAREDGTGYAVGEDSLPASGDGEITDPDDAMYRVVKDAEGMLAGTRFDLPMVGRTMQINVTGTGNPAPRLNADDPDTDANEAGTMLEALKEKFPMDELLGDGESTVNAATIVSTARGEIAKIRDRVAQLVALYRDEGITRTVLNNQVSEQWAAADVQLRNIFGGTEETRTLERESSPDRVVAAFDRVVEALSSEEAFAAATLAGGPDALQGFLERNATEAAAAFNRPKSTSTARLGVLESTRFGVATFNETATAQAGFGSAERVQAFAWSTMEATRRASDVRASGYGHYTGQTLAADQAGNHYSGTIDIEVRFVRMAVDGLVTGLARADTQEPWSHGLGGVVTRIALPTATLGRTGSWMVTNRSATNRGRMSFVNRAGSWPDEALGVGSSFSGRLLGTGDAAGSEAIGTWEAVAGNTTLAGAFGATRGADRERPGAALTSNTTAIGQTGNARATIEIGPAALAAIMDDEDTMDVDESRPAIAASTVINTGNTKFKYNPPPMDTAAADEFVNGNYEPQRAAVLEAGDWKLEKGNWVEDVRAEITKKLGQLRRSIAFDGADASDDDRTFANQQRQALFDDIQAELEKIFDKSQGNRGENEEFYTGVLTRATTSLTDNARWTAAGSDFHEDYPVNSAGVAQDAGVLAEIEDVLAALADADAFAAQFQNDGLFADINVDAEGENMRVADFPSPSAIFGRPRGELRVVAAATDFTRLGAWRHRVSDNAVSALRDQDTERGGRGEEFGAFAYSPLDPTAAYASATSRLYPARGAAGPVSASYAGQTVASETIAAADGGSKFYEGAVEATVFWDPDAVTDSKVSVTVSDLTDRDSGEALSLGGSFEVGSLKWTADVANDGGLVKFTSDEVRASAAGLGGGELAPTYNRNLRFEHVSNWQQADDYNFGPNNNDYRRLKGTHAEDWGSMSFTDVRSGGSTNNPNAAQRAQLATDQENLQMPVWAVKGPRVNTTQSTNNDKPTFIFVFRDGSMLQFADQHGTTWLSGYNSILNRRWVPAIGVEAQKNPDNIYATRVPGSPALSANNGEHLFSRAGGPFVGGWPTTGDSGAGTGQPSMSPSELFLSYVSDRGYDFETSAELEGMFVGQDADGPLGMIGTWSMGPIRGAFGADLQP